MCPLPDVDTLGTYAGALLDYSAPVDATRDRPAAGANPAYGNVAMMTHTAVRAIVRFAPQGSGTPILAATGMTWDAVWKQATATAPTFARSVAGTYTITFPATVNDEIAVDPVGGPGGLAAGHTVAFRGARCTTEGGAVWFPQATASANVITVLTFNTSFALADPNGPIFFVEAY